MTALAVGQGRVSGGQETSWATAAIQTQGTSHYKSRLDGFWARKPCMTVRRVGVVSVREGRMWLLPGVRDTKNIPACHMVGTVPLQVYISALPAQTVSHTHRHAICEGRVQEEWDTDVWKHYLPTKILRLQTVPYKQLAG